MKYGEKESKLFENAILKRNKAVLRKKKFIKSWLRTWVTRVTQQFCLLLI